MKRTIGMVLTLVALVTPADAVGQTVDDIVRAAAETIGATGIENLRFSGSGSSYAYGSDSHDPEAREYARVATYVEEMTYPTLSARFEITRLVGETRSEQIETRTADLDEPWDSQIDLWLNPHMFLRQALVADGATVEPVKELGVDYQVVRFDTPSGHPIAGYIDSDNMLRKIRAEVGDRTVEGSFRDYADFGGIQFPKLVIHKEGKSPTLILIVSDVQHDDASA